MSAFTFQIRDLDEGPRSYSFEIPPPWATEVLADARVRADGPPGALKVLAQQNGRSVLVTGKLKMGLVAECIRCLGDAPLSVDVDVTTMFSPPDLAPQDEDDDADVEVFHGEKIDLGELVRQNLLLEVPMQPLCREDCPGISVPAGAVPPGASGT